MQCGLQSQGEPPSDWSAVPQWMVGVHQLQVDWTHVAEVINSTVKPEIIHTPGKFWLKVTFIQPEKFFLP